MSIRMSNDGEGLEEDMVIIRSKPTKNYGNREGQLQEGLQGEEDTKDDWKKNMDKFLRKQRYLLYLDDIKQAIHEHEKDSGELK